MKSELSISAVLPARAVQPVLQRWALGQLLSATVIGRDPSNSTLVEIDGQQFRAAEGLSLPPGTRLPVRVAQLGDVPVLEILSEPARGSGDPARSAAMRELLPRQIPQAQGLRELATLMTRLAPAAHQAATPAPFAGLRALLADLPELESLAAPRSLRGALTQSGAGLEKALARAVTSDTSKLALPTADFKWRLLELRAQVETLPQGRAASGNLPVPEASGVSTAFNSPNQPPSSPQTAGAGGRAPHAAEGSTATLSPPALPEARPAMMDPARRQLVDSIDGMLARVTSLQLQMADAAANGIPLGIFEIPVQLDEVPHSLLLQIESGGGEAEAEAISPLTVTMAVPISGSEEMLVRMTAHGETLHVAMWSDAQALRRTLETRRDDLRDRLEQSGFNVAGVNVTPLAIRREILHQPAGLIRATV